MLLFLIWNWWELMRARRGLLIATCANLFTSLCSFTASWRKLHSDLSRCVFFWLQRVQTEGADVETHSIIPDVRRVFFEFAVPGEVAAQNYLASRL